MGVVKSTKIELEGRTLKISNLQSVVITRSYNRLSVVIAIYLDRWTVRRYIYFLATDQVSIHMDWTSVLSAGPIRA
jgi:hypothetical protein